jgi:hypothetical protein
LAHIIWLPPCLGKALGFEALGPLLLALAWWPLHRTPFDSDSASLPPMMKVQHLKSNARLARARGAEVHHHQPAD